MVLVTFVLTGLIGNRLLQRWQHRTWLHQQKILGREKEYASLLELTNELSAATGARLYHMRRLAAAIRSLSDAELEHRLKKYDAILIRWNEALNSYYVRLTFYTDFYEARNLEDNIQNLFAKTGINIEASIRDRRSGKRSSPVAITAIDHNLTRLQGQILQFNKGMLRTVETKRKELYLGAPVYYSEYNLLQFSTWELIKALFISEVDGHAVIRTALDLSAPNGSF